MRRCKEGGKGRELEKMNPMQNPADANIALYNFLTYTKIIKIKIHSLKMDSLR